MLLLEFEHITPMSLRQTESRAHDTYLTRVMKGRWADYRDAEASFWNVRYIFFEDYLVAQSLKSTLDTFRGNHIDKG